MISQWKLLADEDFDRRIVRGVLRLLPELHFVTNQEVGLSGAKDFAVLLWAESHDHLVFSHDVNTMRQQAYRHLEAGNRLPGLFLLPATVSIKEAIDEITALVECSQPEEWEGQVNYLPF